MRPGPVINSSVWSTGKTVLGRLISGTAYLKVSLLSLIEWEVTRAIQAHTDYYSFANELTCAGPRNPRMTG